VTDDTIDQIDRIETRSVTDLTSGSREVLVTSQYVPPLDGISDDYEGFDMRVAEGMGLLLNKHYFGYQWKTYADTKQGIVGFSIPELMGPTLHVVINLKKFEALDPQLIVEKAGELLERMGLPRGRADMELILAAKQRRHTFQFDGPGGRKIQ